MPGLLVRQPSCGPIRLPPWSIAAVVLCAVASWSGRCSATQPPTAAATQRVDPARFDPRVRGLVTITHVGRDQWRFEYDLSRDARSIMLGPKAEKYHATAWQLPEAFHVLPQGPYSFLERRDGEPFRQVVIEVRAYHPVVPYAPQPFAVFDNGTAINTGPLGFAARIGETRMMMAFVPKYSFVGTPDETVVVPGKKPGAVTRIELPQRPFVYFGKLDGLRETDRVQSILDTDFPRGLTEPYVASVEAYAALYDRRLRDALPDKLVIMVAYQGAPALGFGGGAQQFQIMAKARGPQALAADRHNLEKMRLFFAHEMAHIWQTRLGNDTARWFTEGEAELLALYALQQQGHITPEEVAKNLSARVPRCVDSLRRSSLLEAHRRGDPQANYTAGALVVAAALAATAADGTRDDIAALDRALHTWPADARMKRPLEAFQETLKKLGAAPQAVDAIGSFIRTRHDDPLAALRQLFDVTDLAYRAEGPALHIAPAPNSR